MAERYLGSYVEYFLAFALDGFINLPYEKRTEPESSVKEDAFGMFHYEICDQVLCIPQVQYLNQWNCHYYLGIWGRSGNANRCSAVITPRDFLSTTKIRIMTSCIIWTKSGKRWRSCGKMRKTVPNTTI